MSEPVKDPFYDTIAERMWLDVTNIGVRSEGMVRVVLRVNEQERELYHSYVTDGIVSHGFNLTPWLRRNGPVSELESQLRSLQSQLEESEKSRKGLEVQVENLRVVGLVLLAEVENWIHDQLDGTGNLDWALAELEPMRSVLDKDSP